MNWLNKILRKKSSETVILEVKQDFQTYVADLSFKIIDKPTPQLLFHCSTTNMALLIINEMATSAKRKLNAPPTLIKHPDGSETCNFRASNSSKIVEIANYIKNEKYSGTVEIIGGLVSGLSENDKLVFLKSIQFGKGLAVGKHILLW